MQLLRLLLRLLGGGEKAPGLWLLLQWRRHCRVARGCERLRLTMLRSWRRLDGVARELQRRCALTSEVLRLWRLQRLLLLLLLRRLLQGKRSRQHAHPRRKSARLLLLRLWLQLWMVWHRQRNRRHMWLLLV